MNFADGFGPMNFADGALQDRLKRCLDETRKLTMRLDVLVADPSSTPEQLSGVEAELARLGAERTRLMLAMRAGQAAASGAMRRNVQGGRPLREIVLDVLDAIGAPSTPKLIAEFGAGRFATFIPADRLASMRRDERKAFAGGPTTRPAFVAPALLAETLTAEPRLLTSSAWPLERRIIGSRSLRVNHLRTLLAICDAIDAVANRHDRARERLRWMGGLLAGTVPGALDRQAGFDPHLAREAALAELSLVEPLDAKERAAAAERASGWALVHLVWGAPAVVPGTRERRQLQA